jgi:hypothetical protein
MSYKKIFWGIILIFIGILIILKNLDVVHFSWLQFLMLWPVLLILWGLSIIPAKSWIKLTLSLVTIIIAVILVSYIDWGVYRPLWFFRHDREGKEIFRHKSVTSEQILSEPYDSTLLQAGLQLDVAAGAFEISGQTSQLLEFDNRGYLGEYEMTSQDIDGKREIKLRLREPVIHSHNRIGNKVYIKLNELPEWDFNFDVGAASLLMDLSNYKIRQINIEGGASSMEIKLGNKANETHIDIEAGASSVLIRIPRSSGCEISGTTVLSSRSLEDFTKVRQNTYETENLEGNPNKIIIDVDVAVSSFEVIRY